MTVTMVLFGVPYSILTFKIVKRLLIKWDVNDFYKAHFQTDQFKYFK